MTGKRSCSNETLLDFGWHLIKVNLLRTEMLLVVLPNGVRVAWRSSRTRLANGSTTNTPSRSITCQTDLYADLLRERTTGLLTQGASSSISMTTRWTQYSWSMMSSICVLTNKTWSIRDSK